MSTTTPLSPGKAKNDNAGAFPVGVTHVAVGLAAVFMSVADFNNGYHLMSTVDAVGSLYFFGVAAAALSSLTAPQP
jgi:hypothetical protein